MSHGSILRAGGTLRPRTEARDRAFAAVLVAFVLATTGAGCRGGLVRQFEYEEDIFLSLDGSATVYVNASIPALVALRGLDLDLNPNARLDRARIRSLYLSPTTRVGRVSAWRRQGRRFISVRVDVADIRQLSRAVPFAWSTYRLDHVGDSFVYRQVVDGSANTPIGDVGWRGQELVAFRLHLPSKIDFHNAQDFRRGNILVWEQSLKDRLAGVPLAMDVRMEQTSILYRTLWLFVVSMLAALAVVAALIWWVISRAPAPPARMGTGAAGIRGHRPRTRE